MRSKPGFAIPLLENCLCQPNSKFIPFFESGKDKAANRGDGLRLPSAMPKIQWASNSTALWLLGYGKPLPVVD